MHLVRMLAELSPDDLAMTTNAHLLSESAQALADAGLRRVNVSLDSMDHEQFARLTRGGDLTRVWAGIEAALAAGLTPLKINAVIVPGENEGQILPIVDAFAPWADRVEVRFIERMPFGAARRAHVDSAKHRRVLQDPRWLACAQTARRGSSDALRLAFGPGGGLHLAHERTLLPALQPPAARSGRSPQDLSVAR